MNDRTRSEVIAFARELTNLCDKYIDRKILRIVDYMVIVGALYVHFERMLETNCADDAQKIQELRNLAIESIAGIIGDEFLDDLTPPPLVN